MHFCSAQHVSAQPVASEKLPRSFLAKSGVWVTRTEKFTKKYTQNELRLFCCSPGRHFSPFFRTLLSSNDASERVTPRTFFGAVCATKQLSVLYRSKTTGFRLRAHKRRVPLEPTRTTRSKEQARLLVGIQKHAIS